MKTGIEIILKERIRQIEEEGWTPTHDLQHVKGELANAAAHYAMTAEMIDFIDDHWGNDQHLNIWPFDLNWLKRSPKNRIKELGKAGALIAAEIDRIILSKKSAEEREEILKMSSTHILDYELNLRLPKARREDIVISGGKGSGKTWILRAILKAHPGKIRMLSAKDSFYDKNIRKLFDYVKDASLIVLADCTSDDIIPFDFITKAFDIKKRITVVYVTNEEVTNKSLGLENLHIIHCNNRCI